MSFFKHVTLFVTVVSTAAISPILAQTVADEGARDVPLAVPGGQIFGKNNPNVRRATAVINGEIITGTDVDQRLALTLAANNSELPTDEVQRVRAQILNNLIDETLQIQEAAANEIDITSAQVDDYYNRISTQNFKRTPKEVEKYLQSVGSSPISLKRQIRAELSWSRLLSRKVQPFINVSDDEVNAIIERINQTKGATEYRLGEIYLTANSENQEQVYGNAKKILEQLQKGGNFVAYAKQFSESSTAVVGGDLGWLKLGQLPQALATAASSLQTNEIVAVPSPGGISLLLLIDKRQVATNDPRDSVLSLKQIALNFPAGTTEAKAAPLVKQFSEETQKIAGCGAADKMAGALNAEVVNRDGIQLRDLPAPLQAVLLDLQVGQSTPPYGSLAEGVRVFVLCGRDAPQQASQESFSDIMARLEDEKTNKRARLFLRDLRRDAIIEYN